MSGQLRPLLPPGRIDQRATDQREINLLEVPSRNPSPGSSVFDYPVETGRSIGIDPPLSDTSPPVLDAALSTSLSAAHKLPSFVIVSGGTGGNNIVGAFSANEVAYVLPVSDNGGSSSEIIRVLGGPSIGDLRSRLIRLIPSPPHTSRSVEATEAIRALLSYRFPVDLTEREARDSWRDVVEGRSPLWKGIPGDRKETIRGFLVHFEAEILKRAHKNFTFRNGSIGNFLLAAMQLFLRSLPAAIFLFASITGSQTNASILPVLVTNHTVTIAAELTNGTTIIGQCEISHPVRRPSQSNLASSTSVPQDLTEHSWDEGLYSPTIEGLDSPNVAFVKSEQDEDGAAELEAPINRLLYLNAYGQEIFPSPNPEFLYDLRCKDVLIYCCGSLWTSIIPCLTLMRVATTIATSPNLKAKVLLLNSKNDRETHGYKASDHIKAIVNSLNRSDRGDEGSQPIEPTRRRTQPEYPTSLLLTHLFYLEGTSIELDLPEISRLGVVCKVVPGREFTSIGLAASLDDLWDTGSTRVSVS